jgi:hypothetical protein
MDHGDGESRAVKAERDDAEADARAALDLHRALNRASDRAAREKGEKIPRAVACDTHEDDPGILPSC